MAGFPVAVLPLWQLAQVPGVTVRWLKPAGTQALVRWHESQDAVVATCPLGLPLAMLPLWHEKHVPGVTATCEKRAPVQVAAERWQTSQGSGVCTCRAGFTVTAMRLPARWQ